MANAAELIVGARLNRCTWIADDPARVLALLPEGTRAHHERRVFTIQYAIDGGAQTSGLGAHSATVIGIELDTLGPDGVVPTRLVTHVIASTAAARDFYAESGCHVSEGDTYVSVFQDVVTAEIRVDGGSVCVMRTSARVGAPTAYESTHHDYVITPGGRPVVSTLPWVATVASSWTPLSVEFLDPSHEIAPLQPGREPVVVDGGYSPNASWCWPPLPSTGLRPPFDLDDPSVAPYAPTY